MHVIRLAGVSVICLLITGLLPRASAVVSADEVRPVAATVVPHFRLFLKDGRALVSYGEYARVDGRVVFSMPTSASPTEPDLQLVDLAADRVDWTRTDAYTESARAARYLQTRADADYALLTGTIAQALNDIALTTDPRERLAIVQQARRTLADWPPAHYNHKRDEVRQMLVTLDDAIAALRAAAGGDRFELSFVASGVAPAPPLEPLLPAPTPQEIIEQALTVARVTDVPAQRTSLLSMVLAALSRHLPDLPADWVRSVQLTASTLLTRELAIERSYTAMTAELLQLATARAQAADVAGVERVIDVVSRRDAALGSSRPDVLNGLLAAVQQQLDAARRLRLERDRFAIRLPELRKYREAVGPLLTQLVDVGPDLEHIKSLSGSGPQAIGRILSATAAVQRRAADLTPPEELQDLHALLLSAAQMADNAARLRRQAALSNDMDRAWNASSAAAGALMLSARATSELHAAFRLPQLPQ